MWLTDMKRKLILEQVLLLRKKRIRCSSFFRACSIQQHRPCVRSPITAEKRKNQTRSALHLQAGPTLRTTVFLYLSIIRGDPDKKQESVVSQYSSRRRKKQGERPLSLSLSLSLSPSEPIAEEEEEEENLPWMASADAAGPETERGRKPPQTKPSRTYCGRRRNWRNRKERSLFRTKKALPITSSPSFLRKKENNKG